VVVVVGTVVVVVFGGLVVVVGGAVVVVVLEVEVGCGGALAGDVATGGPSSTSRSALGGRDGIDFRDDALLRRNGGEVVMVVPTATAVVVVVVRLGMAVGTVVVAVTCWTESVGGGGRVSVSTKAHTAPLTASTATTSATPGYQTPSR
jgi:hypothetical protein